MKPAVLLLLLVIGNQDDPFMEYKGQIAYKVATMDECWEQAADVNRLAFGNIVGAHMAVCLPDMNIGQKNKPKE